MAKCLVRDPEERWTAAELLGHPFLASAASNGVRKSTKRSPTSVMDQCFWDELEVPDCASDPTESPSASDSPAGRIGCLIGDGLNFDYSAAAAEEGWITVRDNGMGTEGVVELNYEELMNGDSLMEGLIEVEDSLFHSNWDEISSSNIDVSSLEYILGDSDVHDSVPISVALERMVMKDFCDSNQLFNVLSLCFHFPFSYSTLYYCNLLVIHINFLMLLIATSFCVFIFNFRKTSNFYSVNKYIFYL